MKNLGSWIIAVVSLSLATLWTTHQMRRPLLDDSKTALFGASSAVAPLAPASTPPVGLTSQPNVSAIQESKATIGDRVDRLSQSKDAGDRYQAYQLVERCLTARHFQDLQTSDPAPESSTLKDSLARYVGACNGVTQTQIGQRMESLQFAVDAGLIGAAHEFFTSGPFGDLSAVDQRPDDPLVTEWRQKSLVLLEQAASTGDASAIVDLAQIYEGGPMAPRNAESLLMYLVAESDISVQQGRPVKGLNLTSVEAELSSSQIASAIAAGRRLAEANAERGGGYKS